MQVVSIQSMLDILKNGKEGTVREALPGEEPDFVQERDKECTGMMGIRRRDGMAYSFNLHPPRLLERGVGYVVELED